VTPCEICVFDGDSCCDSKRCKILKKYNANPEGWIDGYNKMLEEGEEMKQCSYDRIHVCRSCGEEIEKETIKSEFRKEPVYIIEPVKFCSSCVHEHETGKE
jgi:hypothetical protein